MTQNVEGLGDKIGVIAGTKTTFADNHVEMDGTHYIHGTAQTMDGAYHVTSSKQLSVGENLKILDDELFNVSERVGSVAADGSYIKKSSGEGSKNIAENLALLDKAISDLAGTSDVTIDDIVDEIGGFETPTTPGGANPHDNINPNDSVIANLEHIGDTIGALQDTSTGTGAEGHLKGESVAKDLKNLDDAVVAQEKLVGEFDPASSGVNPHDNIDPSKSVVDNLEALGDTVGTFSGAHDNIDNTKSLAENIEGLGEVLGSVADSTSHYGTSATDVAGKLGALDTQVYTNAGAISTLTDQLGIIGTLPTGSNLVASGEFVKDTNTVAQNLESLDRAIGNRGGIVNNKSVQYTMGSLRGDLSSAISQLASNIGLGADLSANTNGELSTRNSVNKNLAALNKQIADLAQASGSEIEEVEEVIGDTTGWAQGETVVSKINGIEDTIGTRPTTWDEGDTVISKISENADDIAAIEDLLGTKPSTWSSSDTIFGKLGAFEDPTQTAGATSHDNVDPTKTVAQNIETLGDKIGTLNGTHDNVDNTKSLSDNIEDLGDALGVVQDQIGSYDTTKTHSNIDTTASISENFESLDEALGKLSDVDLVLAKNLTDTSVAGNLKNLDNALGDIAATGGHYIGTSNDVAGKLGALDTQVYTNTTGISDINDKLGIMKAAAQTKGNIYGGAFAAETNTVAQNLEKLDEAIGNLADASGAGLIDGDDVATKLATLKSMIGTSDGAIDDIEDYLGEWDSGSTPHANIDPRKSLTANVEDLGDKIGTFNTSGSHENIDTGVSIAENLQSLDKALVELAGDVGSYSDSRTPINIDPSKSLAANVEKLDEKIGTLTKTDTSAAGGHLAGNNVGADLANLDSALVYAEKLLGDWDNNTYANIDKRAGATVAHNVEHLGEIIGGPLTNDKGNLFSDGEFSSSNTVAKNLDSLDKAIGKLTAGTNRGDTLEVAAQLAKLDEAITNSSGSMSDKIEEIEGTIGDMTQFANTSYAGAARGATNLADAIAAVDGLATQNASDIDAVEGRMDVAEADIDAIEETVGDMTKFKARTYEGAAQDAETLVDAIVAVDSVATQNTADIAQNASNITALGGRMDTAEGDIDALEGRMDTAEGSIATNTSNIGTMSDLANTNYAANANNLVAAISAVDSQTKNNTDSIGTINTTLGNIAGATGHYMGNATDVAGKLGALDSQVYDIAEGMTTLDDKLGVMKPTAQTKGNINGGAFDTTGNTVAKNLEKLDTNIGDLSETVEIAGGDVASKLMTLHGMIDSSGGAIEEIQEHLGDWDTSSTPHANIDQRKSLTANVEDLGDKIGTFDASGSLEHLDTGMSISQNMQSLDKAIVDVAEDIGTLESGHKNVDANLSLADNIENLGDKIGDTSGWAAGDTIASKIAANAGNISDLQSHIGSWDNSTYANINKAAGATLTHNVEHLGEIIGTITSGVNITAEPFSADNTVADNLMSLDDIIGNVAGVTVIAGDDVAAKLLSLNSKIDESSGSATEEAKDYTDSKLAGYTVDEQGNHIPADMVIGDEAKTITIGKTQSVGSSEELIAGAKIDTEGRTVEIAAQKDNGDRTGLDMDAINQKINLGAERDGGDVKSGLDIDNQNEIIELLTSDDNTKRSSGIKIDNDDSGKQKIVIGSKDTYHDKVFGITVTSDFSGNGKSSVEIGDGDKKVSISEGGDLQVDGMANFGTENGKQVTVMNGNVYADGKVSSSEVVTKTAQIDSSATIGKDGEPQVKIANGDVEADGKVTSEAIETKTAQIDTSATIGKDGEPQVTIGGGNVNADGNIGADGNIEAGGNMIAHGDLQVDGAATFGDVNGKHVTIDDGTVTASESVVVGSTDGTNVTLGKDGSITSNGANGKVEIADGVITTTGSDGKQVIIGNGKVTADAIDVEGIEAKTGAFDEKVEVGSGESKVTIAGGNIDALSGEFKNSLKLAGDVVDKIDTGTKPVTSDYADAGKAVATVATINATVGDAAGLTGANLSSKGADGEATVADHLGTLNEAIGDRKYTNGNVISDGDSVTEAFDKIDTALGDVAGINGTYANTGVVATDMAAMDKQVAQNAKNIGDMGDLKNGAISNKDNLSKAVDSLADNVEAGMGGKFDENGKWSAEISDDKAVTYGTISADSLSGAIEQVNSNIGTIEDLGVDASGNGANGISAENSVNKNIASVNAAIGDLKNLSLDLKNLTNGKEAKAENAPKSVVEALNNLDGTLGQIHGLATKLGSKYNGNLASGTTVEQHLTAIDAAIGNRKDITNTMSVNYDEAAIQNRNIASTISQVASNIGTAADLGENLINGVSATKTVNANIAAVNAAVGNIEDLKGTFLVSDAGNLTDAVRVLDADMYQLSGAVNTTWRDLKELHHEVRAGMASMAAMSALVPNPRAHGNTSLSLGTGAYSGHGAVAVGGFHHITDNLMLNAGVAWGNSKDAGYRMGVTYSF